MTRSQPSQSRDHSVPRGPRSWTTLAAFVVGVPLAVGILTLVHAGLVAGELSQRYVHHPVEKVEVLLFCCAISALGAKWWASRTERASVARCAKRSVTATGQPYGRRPPRRITH